MVRFQQLYKFSNYLLITPPYNFKKQYLINSEQQRRLKLILVCFGLLAECYLLYIRVSLYFTRVGTRITTIILDCINEVYVIVLYVAMTFDITFKKAKLWKLLFETLASFDKKLKNEKRGIDTKIFKYVIWFRAVAGHIWYFSVYAALWGYSIVVAQKYHSTLSYLWTYLFLTIVYYMIFYMTIIQTAIIFNVRIKYKTLNRNMRKLVIWNCSEIELIYKVRHIGQLYLSLAKCVDLFNSLFGYIIFCTIGNMLIRIFASVNLCLETMDGYSDTFSILVHIAATAFLITCSVILVLDCERCVSEAVYTTGLCFSFEQTLSPKSNLRAELLKLGQLTKANIPKLTAAGYFDIDKTIILSWFSVIATYSLVLIQLNEKS